MLQLTPAIEKCRITSGPLASSQADGRNGAFRLGAGAFVIISDATGWKESGLPGLPWEHVSVSIPGAGRCPTWGEMCCVKQLFFKHDETVIQFHPPKSDYVNVHEHCLHLWRPCGRAIPMPPVETV